MQAWLKENRWTVALLAVLLLGPLYPGLTGYVHFSAAFMVIVAIVAVALNLLTGVAGQISLGHSGFIALGAYATMILVKAGLSYWLALPAAGLLAGLIGFLLGLPALRLQTHYLALATLGFAVVVPQVALKWDRLTGGYQGIKMDRPTLFGLPLTSDLAWYYVVLATAVLLVWMAMGLVRSRAGRALIALRDSEVAAVAMGVHLAFYRTMAFAISGAFTGVAGGLYAGLLKIVSPFDFPATLSFFYLIMIVIGGLGSIWGAIGGAVFHTVAYQVFNRFTGLTLVFEGIAIILVVLFLPHGFASLPGKVRSWRNRRKEVAARGAA